MRVVLTFLLLGLAAVACDSGGDYPPASYCASSADCPSAMVCEFSTTAGCSAPGECATAPAVPCAPQTVCSCMGTTANVCVIDGYTLSTPVRATGACEGGSSAAPVDAGADDGG
jgi:hypothetical protein